MDNKGSHADAVRVAATTYIMNHSATAATTRRSQRHCYATPHTLVCSCNDGCERCHGAVRALGVRCLRGKRAVAVAAAEGETE